MDKSLETYPRNRWNVVGNLCQTSLENRWTSMPEIFGTSWKPIAEFVGQIVENSMPEIVANLCQKSLEQRWKPIAETVGKSLETYARNCWKIVGILC